MSESSPDLWNSELWYGIGVGAAGFVATILGLKYGGGKREGTAERVTGLAIAGGIYQTGQTTLGQQNLTDMLKAARELTAAVKSLAKVASDLADSIAHFDETTGREAKDKTAVQLDELKAEIHALRRDRPS